ncbi:unnamed protein product, partial [Ilex paraguariensis]
AWSGSVHSRNFGSEGMVLVKPSNVLSPPGRDFIISSVKARYLPRDGLELSGFVGRLLAGSWWVLFIGGWYVGSVGGAAGLMQAVDFGGSLSRCRLGCLVVLPGTVDRLG